MLKRSKQSTIGRGFEALEPRQMMAGDVSVAFGKSDAYTLEFKESPNTTKQVNTGQDNHIYVERISATQIRVTGSADGLAPTDTTINGRSSQVFNFQNGGRSLSFNMGGGNDSVTVDSGSEASFTMNKLSIKMGAGSDTVSLISLNVRQTTSISTDDVVTFDNVAQQGKDRVEIYNTTFVGTTTIKTGGKSDYIALLSVVTGDDIVIDTANSGTDSAGDSVILTDVVCGNRSYKYEQGLIKITTGNGGDTITLKNSKTDFIQIDALGGDDTVSLESVYVDNDGISYVDGGTGGRDKLVKKNITGAGIAYLNKAHWTRFEI
jgi:hypothetical protein